MKLNASEVYCWITLTHLSLNKLNMCVGSLPRDSFGANNYDATRFVSDRRILYWLTHTFLLNAEFTSNSTIRLFTTLN